MLAKAVWVWSRLGYHSRSCRRGASIGVLLCGPVTDQIPKDEDTQPSYVDDMELVQRNSMGSSCRGDLTTSPTGWLLLYIWLRCTVFQFCFPELFREEVTKQSITPDLMLQSLFVDS